MESTVSHTFRKKERMVSRKLMEQLFEGGKARSASAYPVRAVYMKVDRQSLGVPVQVLITVSKRHFKRAVKRNRVKRQIREAYRLNKQILTDRVEQTSEDLSLAVAFIWLADRLYETAEIEDSVKSLLHRISERVGDK